MGRGEVSLNTAERRQGADTTAASCGLASFI